MLIALYIVTMDYIIPLIFNSLVQPTLLIIIALVGLTFIFVAVEFQISQNPSSSITSNIFSTIRSIGTQLFHAVIWIVINTFLLLPRVYNSMYKTFVEAGVNKIVSFLLSGLVAIVAFVIVI